MGKKSEFKRFDDAMGRLLSVSHDELKAKLDAERATKQSKPKHKRIKKNDAGN